MFPRYFQKQNDPVIIILKLNILVSGFAMRGFDENADKTGAAQFSLSRLHGDQKH